MTCACISHNCPEADQTDPEVILTVPADLRATIGRDTVCVDACIADLIMDMWTAGIVTRGSCCGHNGRHRRSVIVDDSQAAEAKAFLAARGEPMAVLCWRLVEESASGC